MKITKAFTLAALLTAGAAGSLVSVASPAAARVADAPAGAFKTDAVHSAVIFRIGHMGVSSFWGRFNEPSGHYLIDTADPAKSTIDIAIDASKVDTANKKRDDHLRSPDFFNAGEFPTISFKSKSVTKSGDKNFKVDGELTMLGVTKPVTASLNYVGEAQTPQGYKSGFEAEFTIKRSEFGMTKYLEGDAIGDEVKLIVSIEGARS